MIDRQTMQRERDRLFVELGHHKELLHRTRNMEEELSSTVSSIEHQIMLWEQLMEWSAGKDPRPPL